LLGHPLHIFNIRAKREKPGLRAQHLTGIQLLASLCYGKLSACEVGSVEFTLVPASNYIKGGEYKADTKTAGSICLLIQSSLPCILFASHECKLLLKGFHHFFKKNYCNYFNFKIVT
jgi:RNA 3'-terminal phosphate cyclase (ATP)